MPKGSANTPDFPGGSARRAEFEWLYDQHGREVWALAYARWMDADQATDIMQEAFLRLWKQWEAGETIQNPRAWLLRVARNLAEPLLEPAASVRGVQLRLSRLTTAGSQVPLFPEIPGVAGRH